MSAGGAAARPAALARAVLELRVGELRQLRRLFHVGRVSLVIGLAFLSLAIVAGEMLAGLVRNESYAGIVKESFVIGGWVALWRPLEIFLYDWWPILGDARLFDRLSEMDVEVVAAPVGEGGG
jgi:hypothetical protein